MDSFPWLFAVLGGTAILGAILAYGMVKSHHASRRQRETAERAAHDLYHKDEHKQPRSTSETSERGE